MNRAFFALLALAAVSCRTVPIAPVPADETFLARHAATLPTAFEASQTLVFEFRPRWFLPAVRLTALGYATVNLQTGDYAATCLSPVGVKLFDVVRSQGIVRAAATFPFPGRQAEATDAIAADVADVYLDPVPPRGTPVIRRRGDRIVFRRSAAGTCTDYEFSTASGQLLSKTRTEGRRCVSRVVFTDYRTDAGVSYPATCRLENRRHGYRILLTVRDWRRL